MPANVWITRDGKVLVDVRQELLCEWIPPSEEDWKLFEAAKEYHERCDSYDATVCTGEHDMPSTGLESMLINRHAQRVLSELAAKFRVSETALRKAIQEHRRRSEAKHHAQ